MQNQQNIWGILRIALGFVFLWAFLDKVFGLGFNTAPDQSWLAGNSPTFGYLNFATYGPFSGLMKGIAGNPIVDILYMAGLLGIGVALILGIGLKIAGYSGALMMILIYLSAMPGQFNPLIDEHIIYAIVLVGIAHIKPATFGLGSTWGSMDIVKRYPVLE
ncbi:MAG: hypothetical protein AAF629_18405 [Chloroflexota bacterium]